jgi:glycosyltransferase involved in cell wall biosynthesis
MSKLIVNGHFMHQQLTGVQRYAREVLAGFDRAGYAYEIAEPSDFWSSQKITQQLWEQIVLPVSKETENVLWSPTNTGPIYARNHVITLHDIGVFPHPEWFAKSYVRWKRIIIPRIARRARIILTVSEFSKKVICKHLAVNPPKVKVVYNGVDTDHFKPASKKRIETVTQRHDVSGPYFLALGSLDPRKNFSRLIEAWNECVKQESLNNHTLVIAGGGNANFSTFKARADSDSVKFLGYVEDEDLPPLYSGATSFFFPSLFEGFGLPVIEAMACGTAVLTSKTTALGEIAGDAAVKVDPASTEAIKEGMMEIIESASLRNSLIEKGFEKVKLFKWDGAAKKIYDYLIR